jgi:hypothetical protein
MAVVLLIRLRVLCAAFASFALKLFFLRACVVHYSAASGNSTASTELSVTQAVWKYLICGSMP